MTRYLDEARRASLYLRLLTPGLTNKEIADLEGVSVQYVRQLRRKERVFGKMWPKGRTPRNPVKLTEAAFEVGVPRGLTCSLSHIS
jgi:hypothetical protein